MRQRALKPVPQRPLVLTGSGVLDRVGPAMTAAGEAVAEGEHAGEGVAGCVAAGVPAGVEAGVREGVTGGVDAGVPEGVGAGVDEGVGAACTEKGRIMSRSSCSCRRREERI